MDMNELRQRMQLLPNPNGINPFWGQKRQELRERIAHENPEEFLTWSTIISTMFVGEAEYVRDEYDTLMGLDADRWHYVTREHPLGKPEYLSYDRGTSGNLVHQAYHLAMWELHTGKKISRLNHVLEIGGGYGAMARVARRAGFVGQYVIADVPEFSLLQQFYLSQCGVDAKCITIAGLTSVRKPDLLMAVYSLSEMEEEEQRGYVKKVYPKGCLICANCQDGAIDEFAARTGARRLEIQHMSGSYYQLG